MVDDNVKSPCPSPSRAETVPSVVLDTARPRCAIVINIDGNHGVRFLPNTQDWPSRQASMTVAEENENLGAMPLHGCLRIRYVCVPVLVKIPKSCIA